MEEDQQDSGGEYDLQEGFDRLMIFCGENQTESLEFCKLHCEFTGWFSYVFLPIFSTNMKNQLQWTRAIFSRFFNLSRSRTDRNRSWIWRKKTCWLGVGRCFHLGAENGEEKLKQSCCYEKKNIFLNLCFTYCAQARALWKDILAGDNAGEKWQWRQVSFHCLFGKV